MSIHNGTHDDRSRIAPAAIVAEQPVDHVEVQDIN